MSYVDLLLAQASHRSNNGDVVVATRRSDSELYFFTEALFRVTGEDLPLPVEVADVILSIVNTGWWIVDWSSAIVH